MKRILKRLVGWACFVGVAYLIYLKWSYLASFNWNRIAFWGARALPVLLILTGLYLLTKARTD